MLAGRNTFRPITERKKVNLSVLGSVLFFSTLTPAPNIPALSAGLLPAVMAAPLQVSPAQEGATFRLVEATIQDIHNAIKTNQVTCRQLIQLYINRAKAYNGVCTQLVTENGASIPAATGVVRAGAAIRFPTKTVAASSLLPNLDQYAGTPFDFGRMEATVSDPSVKQQFGMRVGRPMPLSLFAAAS